MTTKECKNEIFTLESRELNEGKKVAFIAGGINPVSYTHLNKSSYIDSFLDRAVNATEIATGINAALLGDTK